MHADLKSPAMGQGVISHGVCATCGTGDRGGITEDAARAPAPRVGPPGAAGDGHRQGDTPWRKYT